MKTQTPARVIRFGAARKLTRAVTQGEFEELNATRRYDIPSGG
ncbi:MAG: hypothetical protein ACK4E3_02670 [Brevundimonas sp.]|jgi:hypothetical protein